MKNYASRENCDRRAWWISTQDNKSLATWFWAFTHEISQNVWKKSVSVEMFDQPELAGQNPKQLNSCAEIHQALLSQFSLLVEFLIKKVPVKR